MARGVKQIPAWQTIARVLLCVFGLLLSSYALYVETSKDADREYTAMCDISATISCSKVFTSKYGRGFGLVEPLLGKDSIFNVPNSIFGLLFYFLQFILGQVLHPTSSLILLVTSVLSNVGSVYLAYILYFVLQDACVVCISTYVVNASLLVLNVLHRKTVNKSVKKKKV